MVVVTSVKSTEKSNSTATLPATGKNLRGSHRATIRARKRKLRLIHQRNSAVAGSRRSRPETPLLKWKVEDQNRERCVAVDDDEHENDDCNNQVSKWLKIPSQGRRRSVPDTVRKIAAGMWQLQVPDAASSGLDKRRRDELGFQGSAGPSGHLSSLFLYHHDDKHFGLQSKKLRKNPSSVAATKSGFLCKHKPSIPSSHSTMEGVTKWDPICLKRSDEVHQIYTNVKLIDQQLNAVSLASSIELKLEEARAYIEDLESEKRSQKKKLEQFLRKVNEQSAAWRCREHENVRAIIDDMKAEMNREKKTRKRLEIVNLKLLNELADSKLTVKRYIHDYQKERKARELIEEVCDELAKEIEEDKAEIEALKRESVNLREEVDDERRMLQMAEVWREERVQMKLIDAKVTLENKYSQMNKLVGDLEAFLKSRNATTGVKEMRNSELLRKTVASVNNMQEIKEFTYEPANPSDIFMLFEEMNLGEAQDREIKQCVAYSPVSPDIKLINKGRDSNALTNQNGEVEEDDSGWETVSHPEEHGSSYSPEIKEVCSVPRRQSRKVLSMAKLWSSLEGISGRVSNVRKSTVGVVSPNLVGQLSSSPDLADANVNRGGMKGCIEWPRGANKNCLKTIGAEIESQKVQLKHVLEHNI